MSSSPRLGFMGLALGAGLLLAGCQSSGAKSAATTEPTTQAVYCPKCETTFVKVPRHGHKGQITSYSRQKRMVCPDCKSAVANFFATGQFQHTCTTCGATLEHCEVH